MGTLAPGQRQRRRLPETAPSSAPRPRPAWPPGRPAGRPSRLCQRGSLGQRWGSGSCARPGPFPAWRLWLGQGGALFSKNLLYRVGGALGCCRSRAPVWKNKEQEEVPE